MIRVNCGIMGTLPRLDRRYLYSSSSLGVSLQSSIHPGQKLFCFAFYTLPPLPLNNKALRVWLVVTYILCALYNFIQMTMAQSCMIKNRICSRAFFRGFWGVGSWACVKTLAYLFYTVVNFKLHKSLLLPFLSKCVEFLCVGSSKAKLSFNAISFPVFETINKTHKLNS